MPPSADAAANPEQGPDQSPDPSPDALLDQLPDARPSRDTVAGLLAGIAARIGVPAPGFDADGTLSLSVADEVPLTLVHIDGLPGIIAAADLPAGLAGDAELLADLLAANLDWRRVGGATFGKLPGDGPVVLCRLLPVATDDGADEAAGRRLERDLLDFAAVAADWIDDLEQALDLEDAGAAPPPAAPAAAPPPQGFA